MNKIKSIILALVVFPCSSLFASDPGYEWEKDRQRAELTDADRALSEIVLKQHVQYNYVFENDKLVMYMTTHLIVWVNNNEAIEKNNKIYISMNNTIELTKLRARAINRNGKTVYFDINNIKEIKDEERGNAYRIFAVEGIELDSEVEYFYTKKMSPDIYARVYTQFNCPIKTSSFLLTCPGNLKFDFRSYAGYSNVTQNVNKKEINEYSVSVQNIPALKEEQFSYFDANRQRIEFKLAYNTARSQARLYTWEEAAKTFYEVLTEKSKSDEKALDKFVKTLDDDPSKQLAERIKNIEKKIKTGIQIETDQYGAQLSQLESILKNKVASSRGITRLFFMTYEKLGIKVYPVVTCSREKKRFDGTFDTWSYLDEFLLYFPDTDKFLSPASFDARYPLIPPEFTSQQGLFVEPFHVGSVKSALSSVQTIPPSDYSLNNDDLRIEVSFAEDLSANKISQIRDFGGYNALQFMNYYELMTQEQRLEMVEDLTKQTAAEASIKTWKCTQNTKEETYTFTIDVTYESSHFLEKAGNRILFKAGELIGPQTELYRDDKRTCGVENRYNRGYHRKIKVNIPEGYKVKNPDDLKIDVTYKDGEQVPFLFQSDYVIENQTLVISILEFYKEIYAPVERYEDFRKVINAAADFNKITLVLERVR